MSVPISDRTHSRTDAMGTTEQACRVCATGGPHPVYFAREMMFDLGGSFEYLQCRSCGCVQIVNIPADLERYYPPDYYAHTTSPEARFANPLEAELLRAKARFAITGRGLVGRMLFNRVPEYDSYSLLPLRPRHDTSILDVGCGNGRLLYLLSQIGFSNLLGVDPFINQDLTYGNGLRIEKRFLDDTHGKWDVVMFHHAFEHMGDPLETLHQVRRLLKPRGTCIIRVPKADSYAWRLYGTDWVQLDPPRHLFLHTRASMEHVAHASGLRLTSVKDDSTEFQFMGSELYKRGIPHKDYAHRYGDFFSSAERRDFRAHAKRLNETHDGDSAAFYLQPVE